MATNVTEVSVDTAQTLNEFVSNAAERFETRSHFDNESTEMVGIDVNGGVWLKPGAAIAYRGEIVFERRATLGAASIGDAAMREAAPLVRALGRGRLYCANHGMRAKVIQLGGETLVVAWQDLLAFEESLRFETSLVCHGLGIAAGGMAVVKLSGCGSLALSTRGQPLALLVSPGFPVSTDPHATVAWSQNLTVALKTDLSWRTAIGHGGQEPIQMRFEGDGFVIVQPNEDTALFELGPRPLKKISSMVTAMLA